MEKLNTKQVIVLRKDLNMRKGKMVGQGAHGAVACLLRNAKKEGNNLTIELSPALEAWLFDELSKKICVSVNSEEELLNLHQEALKLNLPAVLIQDQGLTEFGKPTYTCVCIGPVEETLVDPLTKGLPLL